VVNRNCFLSFRYYYIATRGHSAQNSDELSFKKGDVMQIIQKLGDGWWRARCEDILRKKYFEDN